MMSYDTISIFSDAGDSDQRPFPVIASMLIHCLAAGTISYGIMSTPNITKPDYIERYTVRDLDFYMSEALPGSPADQEGLRPDASVPAAAERIAAYLQSQHSIAQASTGSQILVQADLRPRLDISVKIQVPTFVMWQPSKVRTETIVAPPLEDTHAAEVMPSLSAPNEQLELKSIAITATDFPTRSIQNPASTTSPVAVRGPDALQKAPVSLAQNSDKPAPSPVISVTKVRMPDRKAALPPVNETAELKAQTESTLGNASSPAKTMTQDGAKTVSLQAKIHSGPDTGNAHTGQGLIDTSAAYENAAMGESTEGVPASSRGENALFNERSHTATVITLAKDGHFGAVVVGISFNDDFPEIERLWSGRLIYTVHLQVGLAQSWILEYSLPRSVEAATAGSVTHLEAPWPYSIVRPDFAPGSIGADALAFNGFISEDGRFEKLIPVIPASFPLSEFVLHCLQQWRFRPAVQNGHPARVEVMLIIPEQSE